MKGGYSLIDLSKVSFTTDGSAVVVSGIFNTIKNTTKRVVLSEMKLDNKLLADTSITFELIDGDYVGIFNAKKITVTDKDKVTVETYGGSGSGGVSDVTVDGTSVVTDGVAAITLPDVPVQDVEVNGTSVVDENGVAEITVPSLAGNCVLEKLTTSTDADFMVIEATGAATFSYKGGTSFTTATVGDTANVMVLGSASGGDSIALTTGNKIILNKINSGSSYRFAGIVLTGSSDNKSVIIAYNPSQNKYRAALLGYHASGINTFPGGVALSDNTMPSNVTISYYKIKEVQ